MPLRLEARRFTSHCESGLPMYHSKTGMRRDASKDWERSMLFLVRAAKASALGEDVMELHKPPPSHTPRVAGAARVKLPSHHGR